MRSLPTAAWSTSCSTACPSRSGTTGSRRSPPRSPGQASGRHDIPAPSTAWPELPFLSLDRPLREVRLAGGLELAQAAGNQRPVERAAILDHAEAYVAGR